MMPSWKATNWGLALVHTPATPPKSRDVLMVDDQNFAIEGYYDFKVSDNITVTPAIFWIEDADGNASVKGSDTVGGLIKTTFKF